MQRDQAKNIVDLISSLANASAIVVQLEHQLSQQTQSFNCCHVFRNPPDKDYLIRVLDFMKKRVDEKEKNLIETLISSSKQ